MPYLAKEVFSETLYETVLRVHIYFLGWNELTLQILADGLLAQILCLALV